MNSVSDAQKTGQKAFLDGDFAKAERVYKQALASSAISNTSIRESGELLHGLGKLYATLAQFEKSEDCYGKAKKQLEDVLGVDHPRVAVTVREMAHLSWLVGRKEQSDTLNRRAVELWRDFLLGSAEKLPDEIPTFEDLFALRQAKEGIANVYEMARRNTSEQALCGVPFAVAAMLELGILYRNAGNYANAKQFLLLALDECDVVKADLLVHSDVRRQLGKTLRLLGDTQESDALFKQVLSAFKREELDDHPDLAEIYFELAQNAETRGQLDDAERLYSTALGLTERMLGAQHFQVAQALKKIAALHVRKGQLTAAEVEYKRAVDLLQQAFGRSHRDIAEIWDELGRMYLLQRKYDEAEALYFRAIDIAGSDHGPQPPEVAFYYDRLAEVYKHHGRFKKAETAHQRALGIRREAFVAAHEDVSATLVRLAKLYLHWGKLTDADAYFRSALALLKVGLGENSEQVASCLVSLGVTNKELGKYKDAELAFHQAMEIYERISPDTAHDASLIEPLLGLGEIAGELARFKQATSRYGHAEEIIQALGEETQLRGLRLRKLQADLNLRQHKIESAEAIYRKIISTAARPGEKESIPVIESLCALGKIESGRRKNSDATENFEAAMRLASSLPAGDAQIIVSILLAMSEHSLNRRDDSNALSYCKQALQQAEKTCGAHHVLLAKCHCAIAEYYSYYLQLGQAIEHYLRALQIMETTLGPFHPELATTLVALARLWVKLDKPDDGETLLKRALEIRERVLGSQNPDTLNALALLATLYMRKGSTTEAKNLSDRIKLIWQENLTAERATPNDLLCALMYGLAESDRFEEALALGEKELQMRIATGASRDEAIPLFLTITEIKIAHRKELVDASTIGQLLKVADATINGALTAANGKACALAADILIERGDHAGAFEYLEKAEQALTGSLGANDAGTLQIQLKRLNTCIQISRAELAAGNLEQAFEFATKAVEFLKHGGVQSTVAEISELFVRMGAAYKYQKNWARMAKSYKHAANLCGVKNRKVEYYYLAATACFHLDNHKDAIEYAANSLEIQEKLEGRLSTNLLPVLELLAELYGLTKKVSLEAETRAHINEIRRGK